MSKLIIGIVITAFVLWGLINLNKFIKHIKVAENPYWKYPKERKKMLESVK